MHLPRNDLKRALGARQQQIGLWCALGSAYGIEIVAGAGFDWLLLDAEHAPNDVVTILPQLQAVASYSISTVVRPPSNDPVLIKRFLDIGAQSLLIPSVESADEAVSAVAATRYPPAGRRGIAALTRATRFGRVESYASSAADEICVIVQVESRAALHELEGIAAVDGVDAIFVGPGDLAASLGHAGAPGHPAVVSAVEDAIQRIRSCDRPAGLFTTDPDFAKRCLGLGALLVAVGIDVGLLARSSDALASGFGRT